MKIGLFVPCYIDQFFPEVAIATLQVLEKEGCEVFFPKDQTCCGQPMANSGMEQEAKKIYNNLAALFKDCDYIVGPSPSCVHHIRSHYDIVEQTETITHLREKTFDLVEFLLDILKIEKLETNFPYKVGLHQSCHGLRGLHLGNPSELITDMPSKWHRILEMVNGIKLVPLTRSDECCGFGGTFAIAEEAISVKMGKDRLADHLSHGVEVLTSGDMSCLMHLQGLAKRKGSGLKIVHLANVLNGETI